MHDNMRDRERDKQKSNRSVMRSALTFFVMIVIPVAAIRYVIDPFFGAPFSQTGWKDGGSCKGLTDWKCVQKHQQCERGPMVWALQKLYLWPGKTLRPAVVEMLGTEWTRYRRSESQNGVEGSAEPACIQWTLGMCSGLGMDYDSFVVCFDENDKVERSFHYQS